MTEIDFTPLEGLKFNCLEECGFCCSFPAEVREWEKNFPVILEKNGGAFRKWDNGHPCLDGIYTFKQHNDRGACILLKENKRCSIYDSRAQLCRTFPVKFFFGWRLQLYPSMPCRGFSEDESSDMIRLGKEAMAEIPQEQIDKTLDESKAMYASLPGRLKGYVAPQVLQSRLIQYAGNIEVNMGNISKESKAEFEAEFSSKDFIDLPTYITEELDWQILKLEDGHVNRFLLNRTGETELYDSITYYGSQLKPLSSEAVEAIRKYLGLLASTDHFTGVVYKKAIDSKPEGIPLVDFAFAELDRIRDIFLLKASLMAEFNGQDIIDERTVKDAIVLYDGCLATVPAFGMIM